MIYHYVKNRIPGLSFGLLRWFCLLLTTTISGATASGQSFDSGSDGSDGPLNLTTPGTIIFDPRERKLDPDGDNIFHFTTINIAAGVTLKLTAQKINGPVFWLATGDVTIAGEDGLHGTFNPSERIPAIAGSGGSAGGIGGNLSNLPQPGNGPGGSAPGDSTQDNRGRRFLARVPESHLDTIAW
jgi:hypothetical protein